MKENTKRKNGGRSHGPVMLYSAMQGHILRGKMVEGHHKGLGFIAEPDHGVSLLGPFDGQRAGPSPGRSFDGQII